MLRFPALTGRISLLAALCAAGPALAQQPAAKPAPPVATPSPAAADPVVATVNGQPIHLSDLNLAAQSLPAELRRMPAQQLFPMLLDQLIDRRALVEEARRTGLDKDPAVQRQIAFAADAALQNVLLSRRVGPTITEEAVRARYDKEIAGKPGADEVHARHILVPTEEEATKLIAELKKGADFETLAKQNSKDPGAAQGGDLGWFKRDEMVPGFADAAFAMQPGQISDKPVKTEFGWHVIQVLEKRQGEPTTFDQAKDELRQKMIQEGVQKAVQQARADVKVERFNLDGSPERATDTAAPPSAAPPSTTPPPAATSPAAPPAAGHKAQP